MNKELAIWKRKCGHTAASLLCCPICDKCMDCCKCTDGCGMLYADLARVQLNNALDITAKNRAEWARKEGV